MRLDRRSLKVNPLRSEADAFRLLLYAIVLFAVIAVLAVIVRVIV
ncbi:MAG TPA: hypothetical protein VK721_09100 [Solirubrobacteraceae bacterium]|nr:hypothetical protein [Solirubrobacteraceae bacterium]